MVREEGSERKEGGREGRRWRGKKIVREQGVREEGVREEGSEGRRK